MLIKADKEEPVENKPPAEEEIIDTENVNNETKNNQKTTNKKVVIKADSFNSEIKRDRASLDRRKKLISSSN